MERKLRAPHLFLNQISTPPSESCSQDTVRELSCEHELLKRGKGKCESSYLNGDHQHVLPFERAMVSQVLPHLLSFVSFENRCIHTMPCYQWAASLLLAIVGGALCHALYLTRARPCSLPSSWWHLLMGSNNPFPSHSASGFPSSTNSKRFRQFHS